MRETPQKFEKQLKREWASIFREIVRTGTKTYKYCERCKKLPRGKRPKCLECPVNKWRHVNFRFDSVALQLIVKKATPFLEVEK
jgi:hypothetical protein